MCGRYTIIHSADAVAEHFGVQRPAFDIGPRYNIAPTQAVPIITSEGGTCGLQLAHWGLVPFWAKDPDIGSRLINARAETLAEKASFKYALARRRCLIPADGFYEWKVVDNGKQPYYIHLTDGGLFSFAGLWETWESPDGSPLISCAIVTVEPNDLMSGIHSRMPAILPREHERPWLTGQGAPQMTGDARRGPLTPEARVLPLLHPYPADEMEAYPVSRFVNRPVNDGPACIQPV